MQNLVSICVASHNQGHLLTDALISALKQDYENIEVIVLDDASTDNTKDLAIFSTPKVKYFRSEEPSGTGHAFNKAISYSKGEIIYLLCSDDLILDSRVISDVVKIFEEDKTVGHVSRFYHQFVGNDKRPCRAWRGKNILELANNPSGMAFRREAIGHCKLENKMFTEVSALVSCVLKNGWGYKILEYDTIGVRVHNSISQNKSYYLKRWVSSPIENWKKVGGYSLLQDYTSLIQIKNNFKLSAVIKECYNFVKYRPINIIIPGFWFFAFVAIFTPRCILRKLPHLYRITIGRWTTKEVKRP